MLQQKNFLLSHYMYNNILTKMLIVIAIVFFLLVNLTLYSCIVVFTKAEVVVGIIRLLYGKSTSLFSLCLN